jgi:hypothetical protein
MEEKEVITLIQGYLVDKGYQETLESLERER